MNLTDNQAAAVAAMKRDGSATLHVGVGTKLVRLGLAEHTGPGGAKGRAVYRLTEAGKAHATAA